MKPLKVFACRARRALAGAVLFACASSAQAVILDPSGNPTPDDPNLKAWFRADVGVSVDANGVTRWDDLSDSALSTARDLLPSVGDAAHQPTFNASDPIFGGQASVGFDGLQDVLARATGNSPVSGNTDRTVIAVVSAQRGPQVFSNHIHQHVLHFGNTVGDQAYGILSQRDSVPAFSNHYWGGFDPGNAASGWSPNIVTFNYDNDFYASAGRAGADRMWVNGLNAGTIDIQATNTAAGAPAHQLKTGTQQFMVGARIGLDAGINPVEHMRGNIAEIIVFDTTLSDSERSAVEGYLAGRYGVSIGPKTAVPGPFSINAGNFNTAVQSLRFNGATARPTTDDDAAPVVRLTDAVNSQSGTVFLDKPVAFANDYSFNTQFEMSATAGYGNDGVGDANGADGLTFIIHQDPRGANAIGVGGGTMGYVGGVVGGQNNLQVKPFVAVELDTWTSGAFDPANNFTADVNGGTTRNGNHLGINVSSARYSIAQTAPGAIPQITTGAPRNVWVDYDGKTHVMEVYMAENGVKPASPVLTQKVDISNFFTGSDLYVGFAGATGGAGANYNIRSWDFDSQESTSTPSGSVAPGGTFTLPDFSGAEPVFQFNGNIFPGDAQRTARITPAGRLQLTQNAANLRGSALLNTPLQLAKDFSFRTEFTFSISDPGGSTNPTGAGADGMTFFMTAGGVAPAALGDGGGGGLGLLNLGNFVAVEFDTWFGGSFENGVVAPTIHHVGVDGSNTAEIGSASYGHTPVPRFNDGQLLYAWIEYVGATEQMEVYFSDTNVKPATPTLVTTIDVAAMLGYVNEDVYVGFSAATGGAFNTHEIHSWSFTAVPEPSTYVLLSMGAFGLIVARRRIKK
jgi:hypothetical protein